MTALSPQTFNPADIPVVILCGGMGTRLREASEKLPKPLVDVGGQADPVAHHEDLRPLRLPALRPVPGLQGRPDQAVLPRLPRALAATSRCELARGHPPTLARQRRRQRGLGGHLRRDRAATGTGGRIRRVAELPRPRHFMLTYGDGIGDGRHRAPCCSAPRLRPDRHGHRRAPGEPVRRDARRRDRVTEFNEKPTVADGLGERRVLRLRAAESSTSTSTTSPTCCWSRSRCRPWPATASSACSSTRASGWGWTPSATGPS